MPEGLDRPRRYIDHPPHIRAIYDISHIVFILEVIKKTWARFNWKKISVLSKNNVWVAYNIVLHMFVSWKYCNAKDEINKMRKSEKCDCKMRAEIKKKKEEER